MIPKFTLGQRVVTGYSKIDNVLTPEYDKILEINNKEYLTREGLKETVIIYTLKADNGNLWSVKEDLLINIILNSKERCKETTWTN